MYTDVHSTLFSITKKWKQSKCPSAEEWMDNGLLLCHKWNEVLIHATTQMNF